MHRTQQRKKPRSQWVMRGLAVAFSLALCELLLHGLCWGSSTVRWVLSPRWEKSPIEQDEDLRVRGSAGHIDHDQFGYRNAAAPATVDVVALGDSQTYGVLVEREQAWPQRLGRAAGVSVYNMGVPGWGPLQYRAVLDDALRFGPRFVVVGFYLGNDLSNAYEDTCDLSIGADLRRAAAAGPAASGPTMAAYPPGWGDDTAPNVRTHSAPWHFGGRVRRALSAHSKLYAVLRTVRGLLDRSGDQYRDWDEWRAFAERHRDDTAVVQLGNVRTILTASYRGTALDWADPRIANGMSISLRVMREIAARCRRRGCALLVVLIPTKETVFEPYVDPAQRRLGYEKLVGHERALRARSTHLLSTGGIAVVDATAVLDACISSGQNPYSSSTDGHLSPAGHAAIARLLAGHPLLAFPDSPPGPLAEKIAPRAGAPNRPSRPHCPE